MKLLFTPEALASFNELKSGTPREADRVRDAIKDILAHPASGSGTPVALVGALSGLWCRYYGVFHQIVYAFDEEEVKIFAIGKKLIESAGIVSGNDTQTVRQSRYTEEEYRHVLAQMAARRGKGETPESGDLLV